MAIIKCGRWRFCVVVIDEIIFLFFIYSDCRPQHRFTFDKLYGFPRPVFSLLASTLMSLVMCSPEFSEIINKISLFRLRRQTKIGRNKAYGHFHKSNIACETTAFESINNYMRFILDFFFTFLYWSFHPTKTEKRK